MEMALTLLEQSLGELLAYPLLEIRFRGAALDRLEYLCALFFGEQRRAEVFARTPCHPLKFVVMIPLSVILMCQNCFPNPGLGLLIWIESIKVVAKARENFPWLLAEYIVQVGD